jgi:hypothetical protein
MSSTTSQPIPYERDKAVQDGISKAKQALKSAEGHVDLLVPSRHVTKMPSYRRYIEEFKDQIDSVTDDGTDVRIHVRFGDIPRDRVALACYLTDAMAAEEKQAEREARSDEQHDVAAPRRGTQTSPRSRTSPPRRTPRPRRPTPRLPHRIRRTLPRMLQPDEAVGRARRSGHRHAAGTRTPRRNEAAIQEKRRIDAQLTRIATRLRGDQAGEGGTFERIVYGKDRRWTASSAHSTSTRMTA